MVSQRRRFPLIFILIILLITAVLIAIFLFRPTQAAPGPAIALCPGPDAYGYTCQSGAAFTYIDATIDTELYADDAIITLDLPFAFTFYGTTYTQVNVSTNGNIQLGSTNATFVNACLNQAPAAQMGDLIAPYWDDLDVTLFGFLEYDTVGTAPNRIFVIEWDEVPPFGTDDEDRVTFEVQLFENSHDILFLYKDVTTLENSNGRSATIGLQSEQQGVALQYSCNQPVVANISGLHFPHPTNPNEELGLEAVLDLAYVDQRQAKGETANLIEQLNQHGPISLTQLRTHWLNQSPARLSQWRWLDVNGSGRQDLFLLWRGDRRHPELAQIVLLTADDTNQMTLQLDHRFAARQESFPQLTIHETADLTHDNLPDLLLHDLVTNQLFVVTQHSQQVELIPLPHHCDGHLAIVDSNQDGILEIARDGCPSGRSLMIWDGQQFISMQH